MPNNVYVGSRYVPVFDGDWVNNKTYEPLTIVNYNGNSYTSKRAVPVNTLPTDTTYWALSGNLNGQISAVNTRIDNLESKNKLIETDPIYIFLGDSYDSYSGWVGKTANNLGLSASQVVDLAADSSNISSGLWLSFLTTWCNNNPGLLDKVTHVIAGGGINDSDPQWISTLNTAIGNLAAYVKAQLPNANLYMAYFGNIWSNSPGIAGRYWNYREAAASIFAQCGKHGGIYLPGMESVLHNINLMNADLVHPNSQGGDAIAEYLASALRAGSADVIYGVANVPVTPMDTTITNTGYIQESISNGYYNLNFIDYAFSGAYNQIIAEPGGQINLGQDVHLQMGDNLRKIQTSIAFTDTNNQRIVLNGTLSIIAGYLQFSPVDDFTNFYATSCEPFNCTLVMPTIEL